MRNLTSTFATALFFFITLLLLGDGLLAQLLPGGPDGPVQKVSASEVSAGGLAGDVNTSNGTYSSSYDLGTVSTLRGTSFTLKANYASTFVASSTPQTFKGSPLGQGWSLNLPTISCDVEDYEKYNASFESFIRNRTHQKVYTTKDYYREKALYFMNLSVNLPGVFSGRLVYKNSRGTTHYFVPARFETVLEVKLIGSTFEVVTVDGTKYTFTPVPVFREGPNIRTHLLRPISSEEYQTKINLATFGMLYHEASLGRVGAASTPLYPNAPNLVPRQGISQWTCVQISNPSKDPGRITFKGKFTGSEIDLAGVWRQQIFTTQSFLSPYDFFPTVTYADEYVLERIMTGSEQLVMEYEDSDCGELGFCKELVYDSEESGEKWTRFHHVATATNALNSSRFHSSTNPYIMSTFGALSMNTDEVSLPSKFDHSYIQSPPLGNFMTGEYYEVDIEVFGNSRSPCLLDLNIYGGPNGNRDMVVNGNGTADAKREYEVIHSTFNSPVKFIAGMGNSTTFKSTFLASHKILSSNIFIEVGPANSDNKFDFDFEDNSQTNAAVEIYLLTNGSTVPAPVSLTYMNILPRPFAPLFSLQEAENSPSIILGSKDFDLGNFNLPIYPTSSVPNNFGIGLPWHNVLNFYNKELDITEQGSTVLGMYFSSMLNNLEMYPAFKDPRWWNGSGSGQIEAEWDNNPTYADDKVSLQSVKVYKFSRRPIVLKSVKKYVSASAEVSIDQVGTDNYLAGKTLVRHVQLDQSFDCSSIYLREASPCSGDPSERCSEFVPSSQLSCNYQLDRITEMPVGTGGGTAAAVNFEYKSIDFSAAELQRLRDVARGNFSVENFAGNIILSGVTDALGKKTEIFYQTLYDATSDNRDQKSYFSIIKSSANNYSNPSDGDVVLKFDYVVDYKKTRTPHGDSYYIYKYSGLRELGEVRTRAHNNLRSLVAGERPGNFGYDEVTIYGPSLTNSTTSCPKTVIKHGEGVLNDKVVRRESYDAAGEILGIVSTTYEYNYAFQPGNTRMNIAGSSYYKEYFENNFTINNLRSRSDYQDYLEWISDEEIRGGSPELGLPTLSNRGQTWYSQYTFSTTDSIQYNNSNPEPKYQGTMAAEGSFFVKKIAEESTSYDECGGSVTTSSSYDYYDADSRGDFNASVYGRIGYNIGDDGKLYNEPSFLLASKTTSSTGSPITSTEEYFYLWDLRNCPEFADPLTGRTKRGRSNVFFIVADVQSTRPVRNLMYEKRTTYGGQPSQSVFYDYSSEVPLERGSIVTIIDEEAIICEPEGPAGGGEDDDDDPTGECVFARGVYSETPPRNGGPWCREGGLWCPCDSEADPPLWSVLQEENGGTSKGFGLLKNFNIFAPLDGFGTINSQDDGGGSPEAIPSPEAMFIVDLARVYVQVEESGGIGTQARVFWVENIMQFNTVVLKTYELLLRNYGFLPLLTEDVMGVQTEYNYFPETHYFYKECINNGEFLINRSTVFSSHPGLPESITKYGTDALEGVSYVTEYEYSDKNKVERVTTPNGITLEYEYDAFLRLEESKRNGVLLSENAYGIYGHSQTAPGSIWQQNYVSTKTYLSQTNYNKSSQHVDPLGRGTGSVIEYTKTPGGGNSTMITGALAYDYYGRVIGSDPAGAGEPIFYGQQNEFIKSEYETAPRGTVKKMAKAGKSLSSGQVITTSTCFVGSAELEAYIEQAENEEALALLPGGIIMSRTEQTDEDGKSVVSFSSSDGLNIATVVIREDGDEAEAVTVNQYDGRGNLLKSINPEGHLTSYAYNYLGLAHTKSQPDEGVTRLAYDAIGNTISILRGSDTYTTFEYDDFSRLIRQYGEGDMSIFAQEGLPWLGLINPTDMKISSFLNDAADSRLLEKQWFYDCHQQDGVWPPETTPLISSNCGQKDRLVAQISYNHEGKPIQISALQYNNDGFVDREEIIFSNTEEELVKYAIEYKDFTRTGMAGIVSVDVNLDGPDYAHIYTFDGLARVLTVGLEVPDKGIAGEIAKYEYDESSGLLNKTELKTNGSLVLANAMSYDEQDRLTSIVSPLYKEEITYHDGTNGYYNGNIYSISNSYAIDGYVGEVTPLSQSGKYIYTYDNFNRLVQAKHLIDPSFIDSYQGAKGDPGGFGNTTFKYDKVGNFKELVRHQYNADDDEFERIKYDYEYSDGTNQLLRLTKSLNDIENISTFEYSHNDFGYLSSDGRTDANFTYTRATYPRIIKDDSFEYDVNDARVHKKGADNEYYIRNSSGQELGVLDFNTMDVTWYCYGATRLGKIESSIDNCGAVDCRPVSPDANLDEDQLQKAISGLYAGQVNLDQLTYPLILYRIQLPNDEDHYLLGSELLAFEGGFNILQQIIVEGKEQIFSITTLDPKNTIDYSFGDFIASVRAGSAMGYVINNWHVCSTTCDPTVFACSSSVAEDQVSYIKKLAEELSLDEAKSEFYFVRVRLCAGKEVYLLKEDIAKLPGAGLIVQNVNFQANESDRYELIIDGDNESFRSPKDLQVYLYRLDQDFSINEYATCTPDLICNSDIPDCGDIVLDFTEITRVVNANRNASQLSLPENLQRVRFCDGTEIHLFASELAEAQVSEYSLLQTLRVSSADQEIVLINTNGEEQELKVDDFLDVRASNNLDRLIDYPVCPEESSCKVPVCTSEQQAAQDQAIVEIQQTRNTSDDSFFPVQMHFVLLCDGKELTLLENEYRDFPEPTTYLGAISLGTADEQVLTQSEDGSFDYVEASAIVAQVENEFLSINEWLSCKKATEEDCIIVDAVECDKLMFSIQRKELIGFYSNDPYCGQLPKLPLVLHLVELCSGNVLYLDDSELADMTGRVIRLQTVILEDNTISYDVIVNGDQLELTFDELLCRRFTGLSGIIGSQECAVVVVSEDISCSLTLEKKNLTINALPDTYDLNAKVDIEAGYLCNDDQTLLPLYSKPFEKKFNAFTGFKLDERLLRRSYSIFYSEITLWDVQKRESVTFDLSPTALAQNYPQLNSVLQQNGLDLGDLTLLLSRAWVGNYAREFNDAYTIALQYVVDKYYENTERYNFSFKLETTFPIVASKSNVSSGLSIGIIHKPSGKVAGLMAKPCAGNFKLGFTDGEIIGAINFYPNVHVTASKFVAPGTGNCLIGYNCSVSVFPYNPEQSKFSPISRNCSTYETVHVPVKDRCFEDDLYISNIIDYAASTQIYDQRDLTLIIPLKSREDAVLQTKNYSCTDEVATLNCDTTPVICNSGICEDEICSPINFNQGCSDEQQAAVVEQLKVIDETLTTEPPNTLSYPTLLTTVVFCDQSTRQLLPHQLQLLTVPYRRLGTLYLNNQTIQVTNTRTNYRATAHDFFKDRSEDPKLLVTTILADAEENDNAPYANLNPITGSPLPSGPVASPLTFYLHDHLGNTRVLFRADAPGAYAIDYAADYLPFGKVLREYPACNRDRFLSTHHERDAATGYDNRGARMYDGEIGRFLGVDPLADHPNQIMMSPYQYVWGNPVSLTDPDGKCPTCPTAAAGAVIGGIIGSGLSLMNQMSKGGDIDWGQVGIDGLQGAATGGAIGFAGPLALGVVGVKAASVGGIMVTGAVAGTASGATELASQGAEIATGRRESLDGEQIATDMIVGGVAGAGGSLVGTSVRSATASTASTYTVSQTTSQVTAAEAMRAQAPAVGAGAGATATNFFKRLIYGTSDVITDSKPEKE